MHAQKDKEWQGSKEWLKCVIKNNDENECEWMEKYEKMKGKCKDLELCEELITEKCKLNALLHKGQNWSVCSQNLAEEYQRETKNLKSEPLLSFLPRQQWVIQNVKHKLKSLRTNSTFMKAYSSCCCTIGVLKNYKSKSSYLSSALLSPKAPTTTLIGKTLLTSWPPVTGGGGEN